MEPGELGFSKVISNVGEKISPAFFLLLNFRNESQIINIYTIIYNKLNTSLYTWP